MFIFSNNDSNRWLAYVLNYILTFVLIVGPGRYHGDQRFSYNQFLSFNLRIGEDTGRPSVMDIVIEGSGKSISTHIFAQGNRMPGVTDQTFNFRIHENTQVGGADRIQRC